MLHGLPVPIKDLEPSAGLRCTYGSVFFKDHIAEMDGAVTGRVKAAGGIRDVETALAMIEAGADRLGTSSGPAIMAGLSTHLLTLLS